MADLIPAIKKLFPTANQTVCQQINGTLQAFVAETQTPLEVGGCTLTVTGEVVEAEVCIQTPRQQLAINSDGTYAILRPGQIQLDAAGRVQQKDELDRINIEQTDPRHALREIMHIEVHRNLTQTRSRRQGIGKGEAGENCARQALRDMLSEADWRRYLTNSFIMIKGMSGRWYQVFGNRGGVNVYWKGKLTHAICLHTDHTCPPTDHVLNMKLLIESDETTIWREGHVGIHLSFPTSPAFITICTADGITLLDKYRNLKKALGIAA